jgi:transcriptional regulator with XRE-family HTH domain
MVTIEIIRNNIIKAIKESGLTQTELAKRLNIKQPTIGQYLSGRAMPALDTFANLCIVLDVDPADILGTNEIKTPAANVKNTYNNYGNHNGDVKF